jgi:hypothetical protein
MLSTIWSCRPVIGYGPKQRRSCDLRRSWHLLSRTGNTCLSIQSLVPVTTFRCHFLVSHRPYLSYTPMPKAFGLSMILWLALTSFKCSVIYVCRSIHKIWSHLKNIGTITKTCSKFHTENSRINIQISGNTSPTLSRNSGFLWVSATLAKM